MAHSPDTPTPLGPRRVNVQSNSTSTSTTNSFTNSTSSGRATPRRSVRPARSSTVGEPPSYATPTTPLRLRTASIGEEARSALKSTTKGILLPTSAADASTWHSIPLAFAVLPAIGGVLFSGGNYFVTDVLVLLLAAVFLHWLVKFPWEWYYSCQLICPDDPYIAADDVATDSAVPQPAKPAPSRAAAGTQIPPPDSRLRAEAAQRELHRSELLALFACFVGPCVGGILLHTIRGQLSRPSEGLVSNFNLTIFILAAELRPTAHVVHMLRTRSLYLQNLVHAPPKSRIESLEARLLDLSEDVKELTMLTARAVERDPDLDALNRAVRRYEKKEALHSAQIETRIVEIDGRLNDVLTLAAAASVKSQPTFSGILLEWICALIIAPFAIAWKIVSFPARAVETLTGGATRRLLLKEQQRQQRLGRDARRGIRSGGNGRLAS